jgi:hypothetical protein
MAGRDVYYSDGIIRFADFKDSMSGRLYPGVVKQFVVERDAWRGVFFCLDLPETRSVARQGFDGACLTQNGFLLIRMCEEANRL